MQGGVAPSGNPDPAPGPNSILHPEVHLPWSMGVGRRHRSSLPAQRIASFSSRELKHRAGQRADEPSFQIRDYVESQKKRPSCCSFL